MPKSVASLSTRKIKANLADIACHNSIGEHLY